MSHFRLYFSWCIVLLQLKEWNCYDIFSTCANLQILTKMTMLWLWYDYEMTMIWLWDYYDMTMIWLWYDYDMTMIWLWYDYDTTMIWLWYDYDMTMISGLQHHRHWPAPDLYLHWWPAASLVTAQAGWPGDIWWWGPQAAYHSPDVTPRVVRAIRCRGQPGARPGGGQEEGQDQHCPSL